MNAFPVNPRLKLGVAETIASFLIFNVFLEHTIPIGMAEHEECFGFNLPDSLTGDSKDLSDFLW